MIGFGPSLVRLVRFVPVPFQRLCDRWCWPIWLRLSGVQCGHDVHCTGLPRIRIARGGEIWLGNGVRLISRRGENPLWLHRPCVLSARAGARIVIGEGCGLSGVVICAASSIVIGARVLIGANCTIVDTDFHPLLPEARREHATRGALSQPIHIGNDVFVGMHVLILKGTELGDGCVVGAGAVVAGKFPPRSVIVGNPARVVKTLPTPVTPLRGATIDEASESTTP
jgi:acetyltransferase-like isoleucine patch superfamily enzyme